MAERVCALRRRSGRGARLRPAAWHLLAAASCLLAQGCPIDDRRLVETVTDAVGSAGGMAPDSGAPRGDGGRNGGVAGAGAAGADSGEAPEAAPPSRDAGPCVHTGADGGLDCDDTLLVNADFNRDLAWWAADPYDKGAMAEWSPEDGQSAAGSGSLRVRNLDQRSLNAPDPAHVQQCVPAESGTSYDLSAEVFIENGQSPRGQAEVSAFFFAKPDCGGASRGGGVKASRATVGEWSSVVTALPGEADVASMMVRLSATKPLEDSPLEVHFDAIRVRPK